MHKALSKILAELPIPTRPEIMVKVSAECSKETPDLTKLSHLISKDVGLSGSILQTINSPQFGLSVKVHSIQHAINLLGINKVTTLVQAAAFRSTFNTPPEYKAFLDDAHDIALIMTAIANRLGSIETDIAYCVGLFHDCGIPILMTYFPDYAEFYKRNLTSTETLSTLEFEQFQVTHARVSGELCRRWFLSSSVVIAVENHCRAFSELNAKFPNELYKLSIIAILKMAIAINFEINKFYRKDISVEIDWRNNAEAVLLFLGLSELDYFKLCDDVVNNLENIN